MEFETAKALARLGMIPTRQNDYGAFAGHERDEREERAERGEDDMGADSGLRDTQDSFLRRAQSGMSISSLPGQRKTGPRRILDNGELNLGRLVEVAQSPVPDFVGERIRILDLRSDSQLAQFTTVTFSILPLGPPLFVPAQPDVIYAGPIVGIVEFGNGSGFSTVEIDINKGSIPYNAGPSSWQYSGNPEKMLVAPPSSSSISVPGSSVRVYARNDASYRPYPSPVSNRLGLFQNPQKVMAHVSYGVRPSEYGVTRTVPLMIGGTIPDNSLVSAIPPFARSFYIQRSSASTNLIVNYRILDWVGRPMSFGVLGPTVDSPILPLPGSAESVEIFFPSDLVGREDTTINLVYNIGV